MIGIRCWIACIPAVQNLFLYLHIDILLGIERHKRIEKDEYLYLLHYKSTKRERERERKREREKENERKRKRERKNEKEGREKEVGRKEIGRERERMITMWADKARFHIYHFYFSQPFWQRYSRKLQQMFKIKRVMDIYIHITWHMHLHSCVFI